MYRCRSTHTYKYKLQLYTSHDCGGEPATPPPGGALELDARSEGKGVEKKT